MIKIILTVIFFVSSLGGGLYVVHPLFEDYQNQLKENEVLLEELDNIKVYISELKEIERKIEENRESIDFLSSAFPEDHDAPTLFLYLEEKIEENNLIARGSFGEFSVNPYVVDGSDHSRIKEVSFELNLEGDYEDMKSFFEEIEKVVRVMDIKEVSFQEGSSVFGRTGNAFNVFAKVSAYSY